MLDIVEREIERKEEKYGIVRIDGENGVIVGSLE